MAARRRYNKTGRSKGGPPFLKLDRYMFDCAAFRSLRPVARALLLEVVRRFNGSNNGSIGLGEREAAAALGMKDRAAVRRCFDELVEKGFIARSWRGGFNVKAGPQRASEWRLTWEPLPYGTPATKDFMRWQPGTETDGKQQKSRDRKAPIAGQENCHGPAKDAKLGQETYPAKAKSGARPGQESNPHIDLPPGGGPGRLAQRSRGYLNGSGHEGVGR